MSCNRVFSWFPTPPLNFILFLGFLFFKSLGAEPRISMCHNNHVYLFPAPVCSIISYQLNLASTWCSSLTSPVRNPICSSLCDAREIWKGEEKKKKKNHEGEKGELTRAAVDGMKNRKQVMTDKSMKEEHDIDTRKNEK